MATPASGAISFSDLSSEIVRQTSTAQLSMNTAAQRLGYGSTSQVSMSDLRKCYGATVTAGLFNGGGGDIYTGYDPGFGIGSVDYATITGSMTLYGATSYTLNGVLQYSDVIFLNYITGYNGTDVNRVAIANDTKTIDSAQANSVSIIPYEFPSSGTFTIGIRFT
jgi:hypothetical protein